MTTASPKSSEQSLPDFARFAIGCDQRDRGRLHQLIDDVLDSNRWSEAEMVSLFEAAGRPTTRCPRSRCRAGRGGALAALHFAGVAGETVLCPSTTFMATPLAAVSSGAEVQFVDCNREDLCMSFADFRAKAERHRPRAAFLVHIGGHIAFETQQIADYCAANGIFLIEDCAHAHGASWNGRKAGGYGDVGVYSLYATKTISTGEGGVLVSRRPEVIAHARDFRNYGKPSYEVSVVNFRMSGLPAARGVVQIERRPEIVEWKNATAQAELAPSYPSRLQ